MHFPSYGSGHSARIVTLALTLGKSDSPGTGKLTAEDDVRRQADEAFFVFQRKSEFLSFVREFERLARREKQDGEQQRTPNRMCGVAADETRRGRDEPCRLDVPTT